MRRNQEQQAYWHKIGQIMAKIGDCEREFARLGNERKDLDEQLASHLQLLYTFTESCYTESRPNYVNANVENVKSHMNAEPQERRNTFSVQTLNNDTRSQPFYANSSNFGMIGCALGDDLVIDKTTREFNTQMHHNPGNQVECDILTNRPTTSPIGASEYANNMHRKYGVENSAYPFFTNPNSNVLDRQARGFIPNINDPNTTKKSTFGYTRFDTI